MDHEPEVIRQQMQDTRAALADKLETLEHQVKETVHSATAAVTETVESVKEAVTGTVDTVKGTMHEAVETVKETLDVRRQFDRHPWLMFGGSVAAGYLGGCAVNQAQSRQVWNRRRWRDQGFSRADGAAPAPPAAYETPAAPRPEQPGLLSRLGNVLEPELDRLKGLAIGSLIGLVRDSLARSAPGTLGPQLADILNDMTTKLGGQPIRGPILPETGSRAGPTYHT